MFPPQTSSRNVPGLQNSMEQQHLHPSKLEDSYRLISLQDNIILLDLHEIRLHLVLQFPFQAKWHLGKLNQHSALRKAVKPHGGEMTRGRFKLHLLQQMQTRLLQVMLRRFRQVDKHWQIHLTLEPQLQTPQTVFGVGLHLMAFDGGTLGVKTCSGPTKKTCVGKT